MELKKEFNSVITVKALEENDKFKLEGYLSTFENSDRLGDIIKSDAFNESVKKDNQVSMLFNHNTNCVIGKMYLSIDKKGLSVVGEFDPNDTESMDIYKKVKFGSLRKMSIGMQIIDYELVDKEKPWGAWIIKKAEVLEGSLVTIPANNQADILEIKNIDNKKISNTKKELQLKIKNLKERIQK